MSQITLQGKQQTLIRVAESRVGVIDAVASTKTHASRCVSALPVSPAALLRTLAVAGGCASALGVFSALKRQKKKGERMVTCKTSGKNGTAQLVLQVLLPVFLPVIQRSLHKWSSGHAAAETGKSIKF